MNPNTKILTVTAPSGTGKTTINRLLVAKHSNIEIAISYTTRKKRTHEECGDHYWFISPETFKKYVNAGQMLEWVEVHGHYYGTGIQEIERIQALGKHILLEIDVQGWQLLHQKIPQARSVFIFPPSIQEMFKRLQKRGTESAQSVQTRILTAYSELKMSDFYDYFLVNYNIQECLIELEKIFISGHLDLKIGLSKEEAKEHKQKLLQELESFCA
jgi:guanylate kinase